MLRAIRLNDPELLILATMVGRRSDRVKRSAARQSVTEGTREAAYSERSVFWLPTFFLQQSGGRPRSMRRSPHLGRAKLWF